MLISHSLLWYRDWVTEEVSVAARECGQRYERASMAGRHAEACRKGAPQLSPPSRDKQTEGQVCGGPTARCQAPGRLPSTYNCESLLFSLRRFHRTGANFGSAGTAVR